MSALKDFFNKMKKDKKFSRAGEGHSLRSSSDRPTVQAGPSASQRALPAQAKPSAASDSQQKAAQAALARLEQKMGGMGKGTNLLKEVFTEMGYSKVEVESGNANGTASGSTSAPQSSAPESAGLPSLAVQGVFYKCPVIGPYVLPRDEMEKKIQEFLRDQYTADPAIASAVMLATFNKDTEKLQAGREILDKYLANIVENPGEEKFRKIRLGNKVFQEKVMVLDAADKFIHAAGFQKVPMANGDVEEDFFVLFPDDVNMDRLALMRDYLTQSEPIVAELDRDLRVFRPSGAVAQFNLPDGFYERTAEEVQDEYKRRLEDMEKNLQMRTKAMRERDEGKKSGRKYRFTVLRVRMPGPEGGFILQGTFGAYEKISAVEEFVRENLISEQLPFILTTALGNKLTNPDARLLEVDLVPAAILNFQSQLPSPPGGSRQDIVFLKDETIALATVGFSKS